jgi:hypothetical protein
MAPVADPGCYFMTPLQIEHARDLARGAPHVMELPYCENRVAGRRTPAFPLLLVCSLPLLLLRARRPRRRV